MSQNKDFGLKKMFLVTFGMFERFIKKIISALFRLFFLDYLHKILEKFVFDFVPKVK